MGSPVPAYLYMLSPDLDEDINLAYRLAQQATHMARQAAPKLTGEMAASLQGIYDYGWFGVWWGDRQYAWYQEAGTNPFTMRSLAGKTIPMWIDDPFGEERKKNPRAQTRTMAGGREQVLIFRKAAPIGSRKTVKRKIDGKMVEVSVPRSYPGAPGRIKDRHNITHREAHPELAPGRAGAVIRAGQIAKGNVGVRWRHPGLSGYRFVTDAIEQVALMAGIRGGPVEMGDE